MLPVSRQPLGAATLPKDVLKADMKEVVKFETCGLGKKAVYIKRYGLSRFSYLPLSHLERVYKRLGVTKGFYEGKVYGTLSYIVFVYDGGKEKCIRFRLEENVDAMLEDIRKHTSVPVGKVK